MLKKIVKFLKGISDDLTLSDSWYLSKGEEILRYAQENKLILKACDYYDAEDWEEIQDVDDLEEEIASLCPFTGYDQEFVRFLVVKIGRRL